MQITFFGAAQNVTGSKHLLQTADAAVLLDCGLWQGRRAEARRLNSELPFDPKNISAVILSHAHADHCGMLPVLVRGGFRGRIFCTPATAEIAQYILLDSAKIQEADCDYINDHLQPGEDPVYPLYNTQDAEAVFPYFEKIGYFRDTGAWTQLSPGARFKFYDAGHILGSAVTVMEVFEAGKVQRLGYTGDLGPASAPLLRAPESITEDVKTLISECTYGDRMHKPLSEAERILKGVVQDAIMQKSKIIVPSFALGRTQELIYLLHRLTDSGAIPRIPIFIDSPLGVNLTEVFTHFARDYNQQTWTDFSRKNEAPFFFSNLSYIRSTEESKILNAKPGPFMVIASSGMAEGGRVLHHLKNCIADSKNIVLFTGYQAAHTLGRKLQEGVTPVRILDRMHAVRARIATIDELSAHADRNDLLAYMRNIGGLKRMFLVHTELAQAAAFKNTLRLRLPHVTVSIPHVGQVFSA